MGPFKLAPSYKDYLWGGNRLKTEFHKETDLTPLAESWELSAHPDGSSFIAAGELAGMSFLEFTAQYPEHLGTKCAGGNSFPILIKLIDASRDLSIQVHPNDDYARKVENGMGKTELWYVLGCKRNASLYYGFRHPITKEEFQKRIEQNTLTEVLQKVPVHKGDLFLIEAGTIHAIGAGIVLAEIQQNSNLTYRVYDYGRRTADGNTRPLHIQKALDVTRLERAAIQNPYENMFVKQGAFTARQLAKCACFTVDLIEVKTAYQRRMDGSSFLSVLCIEGEGELQWRDKGQEIRKGDSFFVPSGCGEIALIGRGQYLLTSL